MMFRNVFISVFLLMLLAVADARSIELSDPTVFSGVETITFQNGVYPDEAYDGFKMTYIDNDNADTNYHATAGDTTSMLGHELRVLCNLDISSTPDSATVLDAYAYFAIESANSFSKTTAMDVGVYRVYWPFNVDSLTWNWRNISATVPADSSWSGVDDGTDAILNPGLIDSLMKWPNDDGLWGGNVGTISSTWNVLHNQWDRPTENDYELMWGSDSLHTMGDVVDLDNSGAGSAARPMNPHSEVTVYPVHVGAPGSNSALCWMRVDITNLVRNWHHGSFENSGFVMIAKMFNYNGSFEVGFMNAANDTYYIVLKNDKAIAGFRPYVQVRYLYATTTASSSTGAGSIGDNSGVN